MESTQANAEPTTSAGMDEQSSRSVENDGINTEVSSNQDAAAPAAKGIEADIESVDSPEALEAMMARLQSETPPGDDSETAPSAEEQTQGDEPAAQETGKTEEKPAAEKAKEDEEDDAPLDLNNLPTRARLQFREDDEVGRLAATLKKRNKDWTLEDALSAAKKQLGKTDPAPDAKTAKDAKADSEKQTAPDEKQAKGDDVAALEAKIKELRDAKKRANQEVDLDKVAELDAELDELRDQLLEAKVSAKTAKPAEAKKADETPAPVADPAVTADYDAKFDASLDRALKLYPDAAKTDSAFAKRMAEVDAMLKKTGDALFHSPDKPFRVAAMVAAELGVAPKAVTSTAKPAAPAPKAGPRSLAPIASGESRTSTARTQAAPTVAAIQGLRTPEDLENFLSQVGGAGL